LVLGFFMLAGTLACSRTEADAGTNQAAARNALFRGVYIASSPGALAAIAIADDGTYVRVPRGCRSASCTEVGTTALDADGRYLVLTDARSREPRRLSVDVLETTAATTTAAGVEPKDLAAPPAATAPDLVEGATPLISSVVTDARLGGQAVELLARSGPSSGAGNGNAVRSPWPGRIPGVQPLGSWTNGDEATVVQPSGNAVTVATPGEPTFAYDAELAQTYVGTANLYNSHGLPGALEGGIPEDQVRRLLQNPDTPLIVASCFSGASLSGGSTIRRMVSAYASDPLVSASRVYGCTGFVYAHSAEGVDCSGTWVDANQRAVPDAERERLRLTQRGCSTNSFVAVGDGSLEQQSDDCPE
jgi:hypothetical protein